MSVNYQALDGTTRTPFVIGGPAAGVALKLVGGNLEIMNANATVDANVTAAIANLSSATNQLVMNSAGSYPFTLNSGAATVAWTLTFPPTAGSAGQVLRTDGTGITTWVSAASTAPCLSNFQVQVTYATTFPYTIDTLPANAQVERVEFYNSTAWSDTSATMSVGITGNTSLFAGTTDNYLGFVDRFDVPSWVAAVGTGEVLLISASPATSTAGVTTVTVWFYTPSV